MPQCVAEARDERIPAPDVPAGPRHARGWTAVTPQKVEQKKYDPLSQPAGRSPRR